MKTRKITIIDFNSNTFNVSEYEFEVFNNTISSHVSFGDNDDTLVCKNKMVSYIEEAIKKVESKKKDATDLKNLLDDVQKVNNKIFFALGC